MGHPLHPFLVPLSLNGGSIFRKDRKVISGFSQGSMIPLVLSDVI